MSGYNRIDFTDYRKPPPMLVDLAPGGLFRLPMGTSGSNVYMKTVQIDRDGRHICVLLKSGNTYPFSTDKEIRPVARGERITICVGVAG